MNNGKRGQIVIQPNKKRIKVDKDFPMRGVAFMIKVTPLEKIVEDSGVSAKSAIRDFEIRVKSGKIKGFYDKRNKVLVEYSDQDIETMRRIVDEKGRVDKRFFASELGISLQDVNLILNDEILKQTHLLVLEEEGLIFSVDWINREITGTVLNFP